MQCHILMVYCETISTIKLINLSITSHHYFCSRQHLKSTLISQHICISNYHTVHLKYVVFIYQVYPNKEKKIFNLLSANFKYIVSFSIVMTYVHRTYPFGITETLYPLTNISPFLLLPRP